MPDTPLMSSEQLRMHMDRLADQLIEHIDDQFALVGIFTGGAHLAARLVELVEQRTGQRPVLGTLDITLYRDDLYTGLEKPILGETNIDFDVTGRRIVLVDDVLFTGRTVRAALAQLADYGRPEWVRLLVLIDRGHRELPIAADYVGEAIETNKRDRVVVRLVEAGAEHDEVVLAPTEA